MTDNTQPEALRDARWYMVNRDGMATLCADKADAEKEAADAQSVWPHMGPHRAVQLVEAADVEAMRAGYAAARLEIESLQARIKTMAEEHADELMVAHLDGRMRAAQPAGAQQPGAAYAELPSYEHQRAIMEAERNASLDEYSRIVLLTSTESRIYERAFTNGWNRRASHGQAAAQAAPAAIQCVECNSCGSVFEIDTYMAGYTEGKGHCLNCHGIDSVPTTQPAQEGK